MDCLLRTVAVGPVGANCSIVKCVETGEAMVVDPGGDAGRVLALIAQVRARVVLIAHSHGHFDHVMGTREVAAATGAPVAIHREDLSLYRALVRQARHFGFATDAPPEPQDLWAGGETLSFGKLSARVLHTPGHTPGSVGLFLEDVNGKPLLLAGDTLFRDGIGRTDFPGGSHAQIVKSIRGVLFALPEATRVIAGHGAETTIGEERAGNPFVGLGAGRS
jgi:glyoxylase-like metal-dependent hydrolase (beta-lactamase superfamily II)